MKCPKCGSESVRSFKVIHELGTSSIETTSSGTMTGVGFGSGSGVAVGTISGTTKGTQQTDAARQAAPPGKRKSPAAIGFAALLGIGALIRCCFSFSGLMLFFGILLLVGANVVTGVAEKWNTKEWPKLYENWLNSFKCLQCGQVFVHSREA